MFYYLTALSITPFFMGEDSVLKITPHSWLEIPLFWVVLGADKGDGKTPVCRYFESQLACMDVSTKLISSFTTEGLYAALAEEPYQGD